MHGEEAKFDAGVKGAKTAGQGRRELDRRVARPEEGRDAVSLGGVVRETEGEKEKERRVGAGPDGRAELVTSLSSRHRDGGTWAQAR